MKKVIKKIFFSWLSIDEGLESMDSIIEWITEKNNKTDVSIKKIPFDQTDFWYYDKSSGKITNKNDSFFSIVGIKGNDGNKEIQQPIILQEEIGYLGIIVKEINGVIHFLMQAKIEPGNINKVQLSPTIQATKSNFTQKHGGSSPKYLDYFKNANRYNVIVDQVQSEQASRFYKKRNRNIIIHVEDQIEVLEGFKWMTLGQIKKLLKIDNLVNMDTRTVISAIPFFILDESDGDLAEYFNDKALAKSILSNNYSNYVKVINRLNDCKMNNTLKTSFSRLDELEEWDISDTEITAKDEREFKVIYCDIAIEGREVKKWKQPLFESNGKATLGLFTAIIDGKRSFLVKTSEEIGSFDTVELGPTVQHEAFHLEELDNVEVLFYEKTKKALGIFCDVILSEEGGRFYHEENRNIIIEISPDEVVVSDNYLWVDYKTLNMMQQFNNLLNIQLRNLLSLLEV